jgi:hypothetical protein
MVVLALIIVVVEMFEIFKTTFFLRIENLFKYSKIIIFDMEFSEVIN